MPQISTELDQLSIALIQTAIDMLDVHDDVPVMLAVDCDGELLTFEDDTPDGCYRAARASSRLSLARSSLVVSAMSCLRVSIRVLTARSLGVI